MLRLIGASRARRIIGGHAEWIHAVSSRYGVPEAALKAILFQEMTMIDLADPIVDLAVLLRLPGRSDSSTGYAQIFGYVGLNAANFAVDRGLATYESLGIRSAHRLDPGNPDDVRLVWLMLHRDARANIELAALNLLAAADEVVGRTEFDGFTEGELKLVLTRYNANVRGITPYGERAYGRYLEFGGEPLRA